MIRFYCVNCGIGLRINERMAGERVRCGGCYSAVRTPTYSPEPALPFTGSSPIDELGRIALEYRAGRPMVSARSERTELIAERLHHIHSEVSGESRSAMTSCSYCGSTIAKFMRKCPFCRHDLWGI